MTGEGVSFVLPCGTRLVVVDEGFRLEGPEAGRGVVLSARSLRQLCVVAGPAALSAAAGTTAA